MGAWVRLLALAWVGPAAPADVDLQWNAPASCPDRQQVLEQALELVAMEADALGGVSVRAQVREGAGDSFEMDLRLRTTSGTTERAMNAVTCETLAEATALALVIAADEARALERLQQTSAAPLVAEQTAPVASPGRVRGTVEVGTGLSLGALPGFGPHVFVGLGVRGDRWSVTGYGTHVFARTGSLDAVPESGAAGRFQLWAGGLRGCAHPNLGRVQLPLCAGAEAGQIAGRGVGIENPQKNAEPWGAVVGGGTLVWSPIPSVGVFAGFQVVVPFIRPAFEVEGLGTVYRAASVGARSAVGLEMRFP